MTAHHGTPGSTISFAAMFDGLCQGAFPDAWPTGEALKLTGLGLEVAQNRGLYKRLPVAQRT